MTKSSAVFLAAAVIALASITSSAGVNAAPAANAASPLLIPDARELINVSFGKTDIEWVFPGQSNARRPSANNNNNNSGNVVFPGQSGRRTTTAAATPKPTAPANGAIAFPDDDGNVVFPGQPSNPPPTKPIAPINPTPVTRNGHVVVFEQTIDIAQVQPGAKNIYWSRLHFDRSKTKLRENFIRVDFPGFGEDLPGDILRLTSLADGAVQYLNFESIEQWNFRSAVFNGGKVKVELLADPNTDPKEKPSIVVSQLETNTQTGFGSNKAQLPPPASLCTAADERKASSDVRSVRIFPVGCTAWTITDKAGCHVTAGHCFDGKVLEDQIIQMNVPQSAVITYAGQKTAILRHPHPKFQFAVDTKSVQFNLTALGLGEQAEDWAYFGTFPNPNTGMTHRETIGNKAYTLAAVDPATGDIAPNQVKVGSTVKIYGYGFVTAQARKQMSQVQQEDDGKVVSFPDRFHIRHRIDTEGGNSGSAIAIGDVAVGIHTNGGCTARSAASANTGSLVSMPAFQRAIKNPKGVCKA
ncbi:hypothetical protein H9P43_003470 [Blastocladiella emersonii ATCC 22665]|nr:hypothetical protein H9P43_003466 [Blastocladiella emersonii ATCC 22665]KAI9184417.1 hypothetical protein H9P43_003470 [Blastocladiella emersonii ATCC 22665]